MFRHCLSHYQEETWLHEAHTHDTNKCPYTMQLVHTYSRVSALPKYKKTHDLTSRERIHSVGLKGIQWMVE